MIFNDILLYSQSNALVQWSSGRLPPAVGGNRCKDSHPNIRGVQGRGRGLQQSKWWRAPEEGYPQNHLRRFIVTYRDGNGNHHACMGLCQVLCINAAVVQLEVPVGQLVVRVAIFCDSFPALQTLFTLVRCLTKP